MIAEKYNNKILIYLVGVADIVAVGTTEAFGGIGVGKTKGICSIFFKTSHSMLLKEIIPTTINKMSRIMMMILPIGSFWSIIILI